MYQSLKKYAVLGNSDYTHVKDHSHESALEMVLDYIKPENSIEKNIICQKSFLEGVFWGEPRAGHPEGKIIFHIREILDNIDKISPIHSKYREDLRLITILHDSFKHLEEQIRPRMNWDKHHAVYARKFAENYIEQKHVLDIIEMHDEAYYAWHLSKKKDYNSAETKIEQLFQRIGKEHKQLFYLFFKCDTYTGDKIIDSVLWFEETVKDIAVFELE